MNRSKHLKGECHHCGGRLEFLADHIGMVVACPHCGQETELLLAQPPQEPTIPRRAIIWTGVAAVILGLGLAGAMVALKRAERWAETQKQQDPAAASPEFPSNGLPQPKGGTFVELEELTASDVSLERAPGTSLVYAVGTLKNSSSRQRFGLKVELELADASGQNIGTASDYRQVLEPGAEWKFRALVVDSKAKSAKIMAIHEEQ